SASKASAPDREATGWVAAHPARVSQAFDGLADQNVHRNAAVLRLAGGGLVVRDRVRLGHPGWGQHAIGRPTALLLKMVDHAAGPPLAEDLVVIVASGRVGIADHQ